MTIRILVSEAALELGRTVDAAKSGRQTAVKVDRMRSIRRSAVVISRPCPHVAALPNRPANTKKMDEARSVSRPAGACKPKKPSRIRLSGDHAVDGIVVSASSRPRSDLWIHRACTGRYSRLIERG